MERGGGGERRSGEGRERGWGEAGERWGDERDRGKVREG